MAGESPGWPLGRRNQVQGSGLIGVGFGVSGFRVAQEFVVFPQGGSTMGSSNYRFDEVAGV